jgi:hypothetical protein
MSCKSQKRPLKDTDVELAYAYWDVARAQRTLGETAAAERAYQSALATLDLAKGHIGSEYMANEYAAQQQRALREYATFLRQTGNDGEAEIMDKRADAIVLKSDIRPN